MCGLDKPAFRFIGDGVVARCTRMWSYKNKAYQGAQKTGLEGVLVAFAGIQDLEPITFLGPDAHDTQIFPNGNDVPTWTYSIRELNSCFKSGIFYWLAYKVFQGSCRISKACVLGKRVKKRRWNSLHPNCICHFLMTFR